VVANDRLPEAAESPLAPTSAAAIRTIFETWRAVIADLAPSSKATP
jgi:hypothetical protein